MLLTIFVYFSLLLAESGPPPHLQKPTPSPAAVKRKAETDWTVSPHQILGVEHSRLSRGKLERWLFQGPFEQQKRVLLAMARIQDPAFLEPINRMLNRSRNSEIRQMAAFALGSIESESSFLFISQHVLMHKDPGLVKALLMAAGRTGHPKAAAFLAYYLKPAFPIMIREGASIGFGHLFTRLGETAQVGEETLGALASLAADDQAGLAAAFSLARYNGDATKLPIPAILAAVSTAPSSTARALLYRTMGKVRQAEFREALVKAASDPKSREERLESLKSLGSQEAHDTLLSALKAGLGDPSRHVQVTALEAITKLGATARILSGDVDTLFTGSGSDWTRSAAILALAKIHPELARTKISGTISKHSGLTLAAMVYAFTTLGTPEDIANTKLFLASPHPRLVQRALESLLVPEITKIPSDITEAIGRSLTTKDAAIVATAADVIEKHRLCDHAAALIEVFQSFLADDAAEIRTAIVRAVSACADARHISFLDRALRDRERVVAEVAAKGLARLTGKNYSFALNSPPSSPLPQEHVLLKQEKKTVLFRTSRGDFSIRFLTQTPLTNYYFAKFAAPMKGRPFHRIVPNFVVQGGDPRGDGFGGAGRNIRDEISPTLHNRGIVGIATAGKDTGSCQFFVNLAPNLHLVGRYTAFAEVIAGMEVLDRLEPTDTILQIVMR